MLVHCFVMWLLLSLFVPVGRDVSSLFCDVVVALYCMCVWVRMLVHLRIESYFSAFH